MAAKPPTAFSTTLRTFPKFFLEAKKPSVYIKEEIPPAHQLRGYAWCASLPLSILSDFEEFAFYDCRFKPKREDSAAAARIFYCTFREYPEKWDEIASIFSREAVLKGSFDRFVESAKAKRGTAEFDKDFLGLLEEWRRQLAQNLALRNAKLTQRELNFAVQRIIDRIIFLRICEARAIEDYGRLLALVNGDGIYPRLARLFEAADTRYNSGLFHFTREPGRQEAPDEFTLELRVDDKLLRDILRNLYYPEQPYHFSVVPADILGHIYEQFLGKVIRLTPGHHAVVEDKPEVKKAGGVYYTPTYIVDYIVQQTVGKLTEGKTPRQVEKLRVLDPACGSGSFLIGAYQYLLDWHLQFYTANDPAKFAKGAKPALVQTPGGWKLTIAERKRILLNNIYGVDIDGQAVEVTKLSLLLKVLEGETSHSLQPLFTIFHERALPDLGDNIKCGNSLIGPDFYQQAELPLLTDDEKYRINVFDWQAEFPHIFRRKSSTGELRETPVTPLDYTLPGVPLHGSYSYKKKKGERVLPSAVPIESQWEGGFDAVIGNPPYVLLQTLNQRPVFDYLARQFRTAKYKIDTYQVFVERGVNLTRTGGKVGYITPNTFLRNKHARELRGFVLGSANVDVLRVFYFPVFKGASVDTSVIILSRANNPNPGHRVQVIRSRAIDQALAVEWQEQRNWFKHPNLHFSLPGAAGSEALAAKIVERCCPLGEFATAYFGIQTFDREKYVKPRRGAKHFKAVVDGANIQRYMLLPGSEFVDFRPEAIKSGGKQQVYEQERVGVRQIGEVPVATILPAGVYSLNTIYNVFFIQPTDYELRFILGLICSKALGWYWRHSFFDQKETFPKVKKDALLSIPVPRINFSDRADEGRHDQMAGLVERILELHKRLSAARTPQEKTALEREIAATDAQIDRLVYDLYGLTEEEIKIVEDSGS